VAAAPDALEHTKGEHMTKARRPTAPPPSPQTWCMLADLHCGSTTGLAMKPQNAVQTALLDRYNDAIAWFGDAPDVVLCNGDAIDGSDRKSHDVVTPDMYLQAEDAADALLAWDATREYIIVSGTGYHTEADGQELDRMVCGYLSEKLRQRGNADVKVSYRRKLKTTVNGWFQLEARHKIGRSTIPWGRSTAQARAKYWQVITAALSARRSGKPVSWPHLLLFAHVHFWNVQEDAYGAVVSLPCWQALGGRYGEKEMDGHCDIGAMKLEIGATEDEGWGKSQRLYPAAATERTEHR